MYVEDSGTYLTTDNRKKIYSELEYYFFGYGDYDEGILGK